MVRSLCALALVSVAAAAGSAQAAVVRLDESDFMAGSGLITFSEFAVGSANPSYAPADYGGDADSPSVTTGGFFAGQSLSAAPDADCPGAAASACVVGDPSGPLALAGDAPETFIANDGATPTSPGLSGTPTFNGPIALLFDADQTGVGFTAGFFDAANSTGITAYARDGSLLGTVVNEATGIEFLGLVTGDGAPAIAGVALDLVGAEPAGFIIDNLRFGQAGDIDLPPEVDNGNGNGNGGPAVIPLPAALPLAATGLFLLGGLGLRRSSRR